MFLFLPSFNCYYDLLTTLKNKVSRLHQLTKASTYYEFFNLSENCSESEIKKAFRKMRKAIPPTNLTKDQFDELVMNGYSVLNNYRKAYDEFLRDSKFIYISEPSNFKNYLIITVIALICFLVFLDFIVFAFRYLKYSENLEKYKKDKKNKNISDEAPKMMIKRIFQRK